MPPFCSLCCCDSEVWIRSSREEGQDLQNEGPTTGSKQVSEVHIKEVRAAVTSSSLPSLLFLALLLSLLVFLPPVSISTLEGVAFASLDFFHWTTICITSGHVCAPTFQHYPPFVPPVHLFQILLTSALSRKLRKSAALVSLLLLRWYQSRVQFPLPAVHACQHGNHFRNWSEAVG